jgi:hypothetical protein
LRVKAARSRRAPVWSHLVLSGVGVMSNSTAS